VIADGVSMGREASKIAQAEEMSAEDREMKEAGAEGQQDETKVRTRRRTRTRRGTEGEPETAGADSTEIETTGQTEGTGGTNEGSDQATN
jgi:hypothetical protein